MVSCVEAVSHGDDELWFGVSIEVLERDQNLAITKYGEKWTRSSFGIKLPLSSDLICIKIAQSYGKTVSPWMLRDLL